MSVQDFYERYLLPRLIGCACGQQDIEKLRREIVPLARGRVFELGCGGGFNLPLYDFDQVTAISGIDPNPALLDRARRAATSISGLPVDLRAGVGEAIPFGDGIFDTAVSTYTLCSVNDPARVLSELRRILKPGGRLLYLEHGKAPDPGPVKWQQRIEPVWKRLAGNCHLTREVGGAIGKAGFDVRPIGQGYLDKAPKWAGWVEWGLATRAGA